MKHVPNSSVVTVPFAFSLLLLYALEDFVDEELFCCGCVCNVQWSCWGLKRLNQTGEQPLPESETGGSGTSSCTCTEDGRKRETLGKGRKNQRGKLTAKLLCLIMLLKTTMSVASHEKSTDREMK